jgi:Fe-S oxidoreductase/coenzyme F420-reducing hydrogenase delta subunit
MKRTNLLGICCNWSPYACYNAAGMNQMKLPPNFHLVRVMCIGRINQALILRAFEYGADGVILLECKDEDCRYGPGPEVGHVNVQRVRRLLHLLGIGQDRLVERSFATHEKEEFARAIWDFADRIEGLGANPAKPPLVARRDVSENGRHIDRIIREQGLFQCLECGKCSASCPRQLTGKEYSPRLLAHKLIAEREDESFIESSVWECLTCGLCQERCPSDVVISQLILEMRTLLAGSKGLKGFRSHDGALHSWMRIMTSPDIRQNRMDWIDSNLRVKSSGPVAFFTGCAPYFDVFFSGIEVNTLSIVRDSIRLLNFLGIEPALLPNERCCGHDLLWTGDRENFEKLCRQNYEEFKDAGVEELVVSCPECSHIFNNHMRQVIPGFDIKVTLLIDMVEREIKKGGIAFRPFKRKATYQDPCRLGRMAGIYDEPRELLSMIPDFKLREMENSGHSAVCCGNNAFINCDAYSKRIQVQRLREARATGANLLVTNCPKCMIHLTCTMRDPIGRGSLSMEIRDLVSVLADQIEWSGKEELITTRKSHEEQ